jgi:hypothetical protein
MKPGSMVELIMRIIIPLGVSLVIYYPILLLNNDVLGRIWSDFYTGALELKEIDSALNHNTMPVGIYWLHYLYGGAPSYHHFMIDYLNALALYMLTKLVGDYVLSIKIFLWIFIFAAWQFAYYYAFSISKSMFSAILTATTYICFAYYVDIYNGHGSIISSISMLPLVALSFNRFLQTLKREDAFLAGLALAICYLGEPQISTLSIFFILFPLFVLYISRRRLNYIFKNIYSLFLFFILGFLIALPHLIPFMCYYRVKYGYGTYKLYATKLGQSFLPPTNGWFSYPNYYYIGFFPSLVVAVGLLFNKHLNGEARRIYLAYTLTYICSHIYAAGSILGIDLIPYISMIPGLQSIRAISRASIMGIFAESMLCGLSLPAILKTLHVKKANAIIRISGILMLLVISDPLLLRPFKVVSHSSQYLIPDDSYDYIRTRINNSEARVLGFMESWSWSICNYRATYIGADIIGQTPIGLPAYPGSWSLPGRNAELLSLRQLIYDTETEAQTFQTRATLYGVKYALVISDKKVADFLDKLKWIKVYESKRGSLVFENPDFRGFVFAIKCTPNALKLLSEANADINYKWQDYNTIDVQIDAKEPCILIISYIYHPAWKAWLDGKEVKIGEFLDSGIMSVNIEPGKHMLLLRFTWYERTLPIVIISYIGLMIGVIYLLFNNFKRLLFNRIKHLHIIFIVLIQVIIIVAFTINASFYFKATKELEHIIEITDVHFKLDESGKSIVLTIKSVGSKAVTISNIKVNDLFLPIEQINIYPNNYVTLNVEYPWQFDCVLRISVYTKQGAFDEIMVQTPSYEPNVILKIINVTTNEKNLLNISYRMQISHVVQAHVIALSHRKPAKQLTTYIFYDTRYMSPEALRMAGVFYEIFKQLDFNTRMADLNVLNDLAKSKPECILAIFEPLIDHLGNRYYSCIPSVLIDPDEDGNVREHSVYGKSLMYDWMRRGCVFLFMSGTVTLQIMMKNSTVYRLNEPIDVVLSDAPASFRGMGYRFGEQTPIGLALDVNRWGYWWAPNYEILESANITFVPYCIDYDMKLTCPVFIKVGEGGWIYLGDGLNLKAENIVHDVLMILLSEPWRDLVGISGRVYNLKEEYSSIEDAITLEIQDVSETELILLGYSTDYGRYYIYNLNISVKKHLT